MDWKSVLGMKTDVVEASTQEEVAQVTNNFDAMIWSLVHEQKDEGLMVSLVKQAFTTGKKEKPPQTDLGHKYRILTFRPEKDIELVTAIIGDPQSYIYRMGRLGYNGVMIKQNMMTKRDSKKMMTVMLAKYGFEDKHIKTALKE